MGPVPHVISLTHVLPVGLSFALFCLLCFLMDRAPPHPLLFTFSPSSHPGWTLQDWLKVRTAIPVLQE